MTHVAIFFRCVLLDELFTAIAVSVASFSISLLGLAVSKSCFYILSKFFITKIVVWEFNKSIKELIKCLWFRRLFTYLNCELFGN